MRCSSLTWWALLAARAQPAGAAAPGTDGRVFGSVRNFAAVQTDGTLAAWGDDSMGANSEPSDCCFAAVYPSGYAFSALKVDGLISSWGYSSGGSPTRRTARRTSSCSAATCEAVR